MTEPEQGYLRRIAHELGAEAKHALTVIRARGPSQVQFWFIALAVGLAAGTAALLFRKSISVIQTAIYGTDDVFLASVAEWLPWWWVLLVPIAGGLAVGVLLHIFTPDGRVRAVADVIEGAALRQGRVERRAGVASAFASLITLSTGGSSGREGPVVHMAAVIATWVSRRINANGITGRDLLGCAVAAAVSASFNAPIAGAIFALEVILRHFAVHAFAPIAIASVAGTVINRIEYGGVTEFMLPSEGGLAFFWELPAFLLLGLLSGLVAVVLMRAVFIAEDFGNHVQAATGMPRWLRPAIAGGIVGAIAIPFPHVIGVGYETTSAALTGRIGLGTAILFAAVKVLAVAVTLGGRMGGGVFSPALVVGSLTGLAFGLVATGILPEVSGAESVYALAGMGAVAAAVLGAPISTTLIVFELTGDWETGMAVMTAVSLSTALASRLVHRSFFLSQLERRGVRLSAGPQAYLAATIPVARVLRARDARRAAPEDICRDFLSRDMYLTDGQTLDAALRLFETSGADFLPVVRSTTAEGPPELLGAVFEADALRAYNRALAEAAAEEHS
ncbi:chloride channel protein [Defluviimonas sp. WL0002]|uniref:Chloride channel protein n=1 Tax=Albidovulum marisflavi TaxID=2984159 RepID=A0ABT2ZF53_9RHOB|nr:chloride channel protein [Defluviimonas sp. WL0002]MCV2869721.1 chloride channel protein [Defluviimonas sp. WL0002]